MKKLDMVRGLVENKKAEIERKKADLVKRTEYMANDAKEGRIHNLLADSQRIGEIATEVRVLEREVEEMEMIIRFMEGDEK